MDARWKPSVTVAAVIEREGRFLLVEEHTPEGLRLNNPAGHLDPAESPVQACIRETLEETAHHFQPTHLVGIYLARFQRHRPQGLEDITYMRLAFCGALGNWEPDRALDTGIVRTVWMSADELRQCPERHRSPMLQQCVDDYLHGRRYPLDLLHTDASVWQTPGAPD